MGRKTKYCLNYEKGRHLNDKKSPSGCYCSGCYDEMKNRLRLIEQQGGAIQGLRAARCKADGSFGYERTKTEKETNLRAFFYYVMTHIPTEKAERFVKEIAASNTMELEYQGGTYKRVKSY